MQKLVNISIFLFALFLFLSCISHEMSVDSALKLADKNRLELEKVLDFYVDDEPKYKATCFLIKNMPGHVRYDSFYLNKFQPIYDKCSIISSQHNWEMTGPWEKDINEYLSTKKNEMSLSPNYLKQDLLTLEATWLIDEIDLAFRAWKENAYSHTISFDDFCRYILPYRIGHGISIDNSRTSFYQCHASWFSDSISDFRERVDSLLYQYSFLKHHNFVIPSLPIYSVAAFEQIRYGTCDERCWFNQILLSSLGMPVVTDYVPFWGNRSGGHTWNAIVLNGKTYPFEPFWDEDRWKYNWLYNNKSLDCLWGKFRLPKVFRQTYEQHLESILIDKDVDISDIPPLFRNPWVADVSEQYFQCRDINLRITRKIPLGTQYCFLCVFNRGQWEPVQWGKIEADGNVSFKKMGYDIIYLPAFYKNGIIMPAADLFFFNQNGNSEILKVSKEKVNIIARRAKPYLHPRYIQEERRWLVGSRLMGCDFINKKDELLYEWTNELDMWNNEIRISSAHPYRYYRLLPASDSIALCELSFLISKGNHLMNIPPTSISGSLESADNSEICMVSDHLSATGFKGVFNNGKAKEILFDLGEPHLIQAISFTPFTPTGITKGQEYELYYWNDEWISAGKVTGKEDTITFTQVPAGSIYRIKTKNLAEHIFIYNDGIVEWH